MTLITVCRRLAAATVMALIFCPPVLADELVIPGSGKPEFVLRALADAFGRQQTQHRVSVPPSTGTTGALRDVAAGTAVLGRVGRPLKSDELARGLSYISLGRDPVIFVAGAGVSVKGLTQAQLLDAYTGRVSNWRELGGKPGPIRVIGREATDASRQAIDRSIKPFADIKFGDEVKLAHLNPQMLDLLDRFPGSLGFSNRSSLAACKTRVVYLNLDGVEPTLQNVGAGRYPLWLDFGLVHKSGNLTPAARAFVAFVQSSAGVSVLQTHGVMPAAGQK